MTVRILRHLIMLLAMLSMVGHPASAAPVMHVQTVTQHATHQHHHHHDGDATGAGHDEASAEHHHNCPGHHHDGKCCDSTCCAASCLTAAFSLIVGSSVQVHVAKTRIPDGDSRLAGTVPFLPDRPPIAI